MIVDESSFKSFRYRMGILLSRLRNRKCLTDDAQVKNTVAADFDGSAVALGKCFVKSAED
jgi:hypothetical protein